MIFLLESGQDESEVFYSGVLNLVNFRSRRPPKLSRMINKST